MDRILKLFRKVRADALSHGLFSCGLFLIAILSLIYGFLHLYYGLIVVQSNYNKEIADDVVLYLAVAAGIMAILKAGDLTKAKFAGAEFEFKAAEKKLHRDGAELKRLGVEIAELRKGISDTPNDIAAKNAPTTLAEATEDFRGPGKITVAGDQQKKRFGGQSQVGGYKLEVDFHSRRNAKTVHLDLIVRRTDGAALQQNVCFYLHESFDPDEITVAPENGKAVLDILCHGGFTAGAWVLGTDVLLELDLALVDGAPRIIQEE